MRFQNLQSRIQIYRTGYICEKTSIHTYRTFTMVEFIPGYGDLYNVWEMPEMKEAMKVLGSMTCEIQ